MSCWYMKRRQAEEQNLSSNGGVSNDATKEVSVVEEVKAKKTATKKKKADSSK